MPSPTALPSPASRTARPRAGRARRALTVLLVAVGVLAGGSVLFTVAANAAVTAFAAHDHGTLDIVLDGETVNLDQPRFRDLHPEFHVHGGHGNLWHHHPQSLAHIFRFEPKTLRQALAAMGAEFSDGNFEFDGVLYDTADGSVTVAVTVDGTPVDLDAHVIADSDDISVRVVTGR